MAYHQLLREAHGARDGGRRRVVAESSGIGRTWNDDASQSPKGRVQGRVLTRVLLRAGVASPRAISAVACEQAVHLRATSRSGQIQASACSLLSATPRVFRQTGQTTA